MAEAAALLIFSRSLIARVAFHRWSKRLGTRAGLAPPHSRPVTESQALRSRRVARAVLQAADRLPGEWLCLPRAMATCWMLRRRKIPCSLIIGVTESGDRGGLDDLHAWIECGNQILVGEGEQMHAPILVLRGCR